MNNSKRIKFYLLNRNKLDNRFIIVSDEKFYLIKFWLKYQLKLLHIRLKRLKNKGIIQSIKFPSSNNIKYLKLIDNIKESRKSIKRAINQLRNFNRYI